MENRTAHSNVRKNISDYNDGANTTHHLGNDDYANRNNLPDQDLNADSALDGKEALGNENIEDMDIESAEEQEQRPNH